MNADKPACPRPCSGQGRDNERARNAVFVRDLTYVRALNLSLPQVRRDQAGCDAEADVIRNAERGRAAGLLSGLGIRRFRGP
jgi:hypothetical protein